MREWNAAAYHRISDPQVAMAMPVLARLPLEGDETVLDVGCGTGRVTGKLLERLPRGRVVAVDQGAGMLATARDHLAPLFGTRVSFVQADAAALPFNSDVDAIVSTATFHWVLDHPALFRSLFTALTPGGRLVAQCGGGPNIHRVHERAFTLIADAEFSPFFCDWRNPWEFADAATTHHRLAAVGFVDIDTSIEPFPVIQPDAETYAAFLTNVICRHHLAHLPTPALKERFIERMTDAAAGDIPAFELDYWRLNIGARRPNARGE